MGFDDIEVIYLFKPQETDDEKEQSEEKNHLSSRDSTSKMCIRDRVKAVAARFSCGIKVDYVELFHNVYVIGNLNRRNIRPVSYTHLFQCRLLLRRAKRFGYALDREIRPCCIGP